MINKTINLLIALLLFAVLFLAIDNSFTDLAKKEEITLSVLRRSQWNEYQR